MFNKVKWGYEILNRFGPKANAASLSLKSDKNFKLKIYRLPFYLFRFNPTIISSPYNIA